MHANSVYVLGLTGGICCGKSEASKVLREQGAFHIDADALSRALTAPGGEALPAIRTVFGDGVFHPDGTLDRAALGMAVFGSPASKRALEGILHPMIQRDMYRMLDQAASQGAKVAVLDVPLLFETGLDALCDEVWVVSAPVQTQISRMATRDGLSREQAEARIAAQMSSADREARASRVILSDRPLEQMQSEIASLYRSLLKKL